MIQTTYYRTYLICNVHLRNSLMILQEYSCLTRRILTSRQKVWTTGCIRNRFVTSVVAVDCAVALKAHIDARDTS